MNDPQPLPFARRMDNFRASRIREILKSTVRPDMISFAGGLPNPRYLPVEEVTLAAGRALASSGRALLQYSVSEGLPELRAWISERCRIRYGISVGPEDILITNGSQQALDLIGKVFLDPGDPLYIEKPSYLGAIQSFACYEPNFRGVPLRNGGVDPDILEREIRAHGPGLFYCVPNFQNPAGSTYSFALRERIARLARDCGILPVEDDPYGEIRFEGEDQPPLRALFDDTILLGSFSKIVAPGLRIGWVSASPPVMRKLIAAKQAADLHSNVLAQQILIEYLRAGELDAQIARLREAYRRNRDLMVRALEQDLPEIRFSIPEGGMFLWCELPAGLSAEDFSRRALEAGVAVVPGSAFFVDGGGDKSYTADRYIRLNFSNATTEEIETGITRLGRILNRMRSEGKGRNHENRKSQVLHL